MKHMVTIFHLEILSFPITDLPNGLSIYSYFIAS